MGADYRRFKLVFLYQLALLAALLEEKDNNKKVNLCMPRHYEERSIRLNKHNKEIRKLFYKLEDVNKQFKDWRAKYGN